MMVRYYYHGPVAKWVRELTIEFVNWYKQNYIVEHEIVFRLYVAGYLDSGRPTGDYGCFAPRCGNACIWLATWWFYWRDAGTVKDRAQAREEYLDTLAHELCHYDKWRRGSNGHRGLQRRVDAMLRQFNHQ
jgi:hypothetical protein